VISLVKNQKEKENEETMDKKDSGSLPLGRLG
jgi:hypothetical protein